STLRSSNSPAVVFDATIPHRDHHSFPTRRSSDLWKVIAARVQSCGLELHPEKTKIVYCKDDSRKKTYPNEKFDFLGYTFRPRSSDRKSTRLNSSHQIISYAVFCLKKKKG